MAKSWKSDLVRCVQILKCGGNAVTLQKLRAASFVTSYGDKSKGE